MKFIMLAAMKYQSGEFLHENNILSSHMKRSLLLYIKMVSIRISLVFII